MSENIFRKLHTDRDGNSTPIISMEPDHLVAMVNLIFRRNVQRKLDEHRALIAGSFAPEDMSPKARRALGMKKQTAAEIEEINERLEDLASTYLEGAMQDFWEYVVVGVMRDDTRDGVVKILQDAFGITGRIDLPVYKPLDSESMLLEEGDWTNAWDDDVDADDPLESELRDHYSGGG